MSIKNLSGQYLWTNNQSLLNGATVASWALFFRVDASYGGGENLFGSASANPYGLYGSAVNPSMNLYTTAGKSFVSVPLSVGTVYHLAATYNAGAYAFYVNGILINSGTNGTAISSPGASQFVLGDGATGTADVEYSNVGVWNGYALTQSDVLALRNQTTMIPTVNGGSGLVLYYSCSGTVGSAVQIGDAGISFPGISITRMGGAPQYTAPLVYVPPSEVVSGWPKIGPSGQTMIFQFQNTITGAPTFPTGAPNTAPTYSVNGGAPITPTNPLWSSSNPWLIYPLAAPVQPTDVITWSSVDDWMTTAAGAVAPATNGAVANLTNGSLLANTAVTTVKPTGTKTNLRVGYNIEPGIYYAPSRLFANSVREASGWAGATAYDANGYPTAGTNPFCIVVGTNTGVAGQPGGPPSGVWTVRWDGLGTAVLQAGVNCTSTLVASSSGNLTGNWATYTITRTSNVSQWWYSVNLESQLTNGAVNNARVYQPGVATDGSQEFHPNALAQLRGAKCLRFMDYLSTNNSSVVDTTYLNNNSYYTYVGGNPTVTYAITQVGPDPNADGYSSTLNRTPMLFTTSAPHGLVDGQVVSFSNMNGPVYCISGASILGINLDNYTNSVVVRSATTFGICEFVANNTGSGPYLVNGTQAVTGTATLVNNGFRVFQPVIDLCNTVGADMWVNVPHAANNAFITWLFAQIGNPTTGLRPNHRVFCELSNEHWNYAFTQYWYFYGQGARAGMTGDQWYAYRTGQVHQVAQAALTAAGWNGTLVRTYGSWLNTPSTTTAMMAEAHAQGYGVDAIHIAPYMTGTLNQGTWNIAASVGNLFTTPMSHDLTSLQFLYDTVFAPNFAQHAANLAVYYPNARINCYEGGPQNLGDASSSATTGAAASLAWGRHSRLIENYWALLDILLAAGVDTYNHFTNTQGAGSVVFANDAVWGAYTAYNQVPGRGDGTDGLYNNDANLTNLDQIVSVPAYVVQQAISYYNGPVPGAGLLLGEAVPGYWFGNHVFQNALSWT